MKILISTVEDHQDAAHKKETVMSHFYATIQGTRGEATRCGDKKSGIETTAASWNGAIRTVLYVDAEGRDCFRVEQIEWQGVGVYEVLAEGVVGEAKPV
jgi:hypothetical protein